ncbi:hypothetical protein Scep_025901 [Stephania cephalantha]|uniref:Uncharacterized protein n=1 Tax=Stephania cephalantha TaxID=152367 RepID=A0AAP0EMC7_9MAGN
MFLLFCYYFCCFVVSKSNLYLLISNSTINNNTHLSHFLNLKPISTNSIIKPQKIAKSSQQS